MAEPRSPLKEFRHLDEKLRTVGLAPAERVRWESLRALVSPAPSASAGGFDVSAAAEALRASLVPAGLRPGAAAPSPAPPVVAEEKPLDQWVTAAGWPPGAPVANPDAASWVPEEAVVTWDELGGQDGSVPAVPWDAGPVADAAVPWDPNAPPPEGATWDTAPAPDAETAGEPVAFPDNSAIPAEYDAAPWDSQGAAAQFDPGALPADGGAWDPAGALPPEAGALADLGTASWDFAAATADGAGAAASPLGELGAPGEEPAWPPGTEVAAEYDAAAWDAAAAPPFAAADEGGQPAATAGWAPEGAPEAPLDASAAAWPDAGAPAGQDAQPADGTWDPKSLAAEPASEWGPPAVSGHDGAPAGATADLDPANWAYGARAELFRATPAELAAWEPGDASGQGADHVQFVAADETAPGSEEISEAALAGPEAVDTAGFEPAAEEPPPQLEEIALEELPVEELPVEEIALEEVTLEGEELQPDPYAPPEAAARLVEAVEAGPVPIEEEPLPGAELLGEVAVPEATPSEPELSATAADMLPPAPARDGALEISTEDVEAFTFESDQVGGPGWVEAAPVEARAAEVADRSLDFVPSPTEGVELATASEFLSFVGGSPVGHEPLIEELDPDAIPEVSAEDIEEIVEEIPGEAATRVPGGARAVAGGSPRGRASRGAARGGRPSRRLPPEEPEFAAAETTEPWAVEPVAAEDGAEVVSLDELVVTPPPPHAEALAPPLPVRSDRHESHAPAAVPVADFRAPRGAGSRRRSPDASLRGRARAHARALPAPTGLPGIRRPGADAPAHAAHRPERARPACPIPRRAPPHPPSWPASIAWCCTQWRAWSSAAPSATWTWWMRRFPSSSRAARRSASPQTA